MPARLGIERQARSSRIIAWVGVMMLCLRFWNGSGYILYMVIFSRFDKMISRVIIRLLLLAMMVTPGLLAAAPRTEPVLLVFGDSLVAGYGLETGESFPDELGRALTGEGRDVTIINGGVSGDTTAGGASRIDWALADRPDAVIVVIGGNDALRGLSPDAMAENLDTILGTVQRDGLPLLFAGMKAPGNMGADFGRDFDNAFADALKKAKLRARATDGTVIFYPFFLEGVALEPTLNQDDGIHPNPAGVAEITRRILPSVRQLLDAAVMITF